MNPNVNPQPIPTSPQAIPSQAENPVSLAKQILQIEKDLKEEIGAIQEILALVVSNKLTLNELKKMAKAKLKNEQP